MCAAPTPRPTFIPGLQNYLGRLKILDIEVTWITSNLGDQKQTNKSDAISQAKREQLSENQKPSIKSKIR